MIIDSAAHLEFATLSPALSGGSEPVLVFVHGVGLDQRIWCGIHKRLDGHCTTLLYDLPGHGKRAQPVKINDLQVYANDLLSLLNAMQIDKAIIVGAAFGEFIARRFARHYPHRVSGLVLLSPLWRRSPESAAKVWQRAEATQAGGVESSLPASIERWLSPDADSDFVRKCDLVRAMVLATPHESFMSAYRLYATMDGVLADEAASIECPALLIVGADDSNATPIMAQSLATTMRDATCVVLPGTRHLISLDAPQVFARTLTDYLEQRQVSTKL
jgi:pimeloyl-ACP methyl ester carboxylesterase